MTVKDKRILIVDDSVGARSLARIFLEREGAVVEEAENGLKATGLMERQAFDLVLTDFNMPDMNGGGLIRWIKAHSPRAKVVIWTSIEDKESLGRDLGVPVIPKDMKGPDIIRIFEDQLDKAMMTRGGIDLNRANMQMNVKRDPSASPQDDGVAFKLDPDVIERIRRQGFDGLEFQINTIIPITNLPILLGLREDEYQGHPQLAGV